MGISAWETNQQPPEKIVIGGAMEVIEEEPSGDALTLKTPRTIETYVRVSKRQVQNKPTMGRTSPQAKHHKNEIISFLGGCLF